MAILQVLHPDRAGTVGTQLLKRVLKEDKADYWEPMEPDIVVAIYPEDYFPFLPSHHKLLYESDEHKAKREAREALKKEGSCPTIRTRSLSSWMPITSRKPMLIMATVFLCR